MEGKICGETDTKGKTEGKLRLRGKGGGQNQ